MKIRDEKTKKAFIKYLEEHPDERFWQAIRNFWRADYIVLTDNLDQEDEFPALRDTFYIEADEELERREHGKEKSD